MTRTIPSVVLNALDDDVINPFFAVELLFDSPNEIRMWTGVGDLILWRVTLGQDAGNLLDISSEVEEAC